MDVIFICLGKIIAKEARQDYIPVLGGAHNRYAARRRNHMGSIIPFDDDQSFEEKIKSLADDELLEIWVESQKMEQMFNARMQLPPSIPFGYEQAIVDELFLRETRKLAQSGL